jgi:probable rRNA maturation factor
MKPETPRGARQLRSVEITADGVPMPRGAGRLTRFCAKALTEAGHTAWRVGVLVCGDERITALNSRYRGLNVPTDVLSFPDDDSRKEGPVCGDIAISLPALCRNAESFEVTENEEMKRLLLHGLLHLAGMDHGQGKSGKMLALQEALLGKLRSEKIFGEARK